MKKLRNTPMLCTLLLFASLTSVKELGSLEGIVQSIKKDTAIHSNFSAQTDNEREINDNLFVEYSSRTNLNQLCASEIFTRAELDILKTPHMSEIKENKIIVLGKDESIDERFFDVKRKQIIISKNYAELKNNIENKRLFFQEVYKNSPKKEIVIEDARNYLESCLVNQIWPLWLGTKWDFYGDSQQPLIKTIACGYFVSTTLEDININANRIRLAQHPSETIINYLCEKKDIEKFSNYLSMEKAVKKLKEKFKNKFDGIYIIGLDYHVGFLYANRDNLHFIHSSYISPFGVVWEDALSSNIISTSGYKVIGKLFGDELVEKWIKNEHISIKKYAPKK